MNRRSHAFVFILLLFLISNFGSGCATRTVRHSEIKKMNIEVDSVRSVRFLSTEKKGYEHPAIISKERLRHILGALEIEARSGKGGMVRQPAIHPDLLGVTAEALASVFQDLGPDEQIGVKAIRKEARLGLFHQKYLTSFLAYMDKGHLYILLRRVEWPVPQAKEDELPEPIRERKNMEFRVVTADPIYFVGVQDLEIDWRNAVFAQPFKMPGSTGGQKKRREVILQSPIPKEELVEKRKDEVSVGDLTPDQLRALADLEDERRGGQITEAAYQRARRQLLRKR